MTSRKQTVHNFTSMYWSEKLYGPPKKVIHTSNKFTDKNQIKPMIKSNDLFWYKYIDNG